MCHQPRLSCRRVPPSTAATAEPVARQGMSGMSDRPSSAESLPTDELDCSPPNPALPTMQDWRNRLIASYAADSWFSDISNTASHTLDEGLWYDADGRMVIPDADNIRRQLMADLHDSPYAGHVGI
jgi:hypothetical protein